MSSAGIDPVAALAQQGAPLDPVAALAAGHMPSPPPPPPPPNNSGGGIDAMVRSAANAATFNLADPLAAAADATIPGINAQRSTLPNWMDRFNQNLKSQKALTNSEQQSHPYASLGAAVAGGIANPATRALPVAKGLAGALMQGAGVGAAYGAGGAVGNSDNLSDAATQTAEGAGIGALGGAAAHGLAAILGGATRAPAAQLLHDEGVPLTIGQAGGGTAHTLEDASTHIPMLGNAIKSRQGDSIEGFNRATYNRVLNPLGVKYAASGPVGNEGIQKVNDLIGNAYDKAYQGAQVTNSPTFTQNLQGAVLNASHTLPQDRANAIQSNIDRLITSKFGSSGELTNSDLQTAKNWFAEQSRVGPTASMDEKATGQAYGSVVDAIKDEIGANDPGRKALLDAADNSYMRFVKVGQAAGQNAASAKGGVFTPSQFGAALRSTEQSTRRMNFAKGLAPMQDLAQAGQQVLPSTVPDSGTALRGLLELGAGGAIAHEVSPEAAMGAAGLIGGGTALYSKPGQKLATALLYGAPNARKAMAAIPRAALPGLIAALVGSKP